MKGFVKAVSIIGLVAALATPSWAQVNQNGGVLTNGTTQNGAQATGGSVGPAAGIGSSAVVGSGNSSSSATGGSVKSEINAITTSGPATTISGPATTNSGHISNKQKQNIKDSGNSSVNVDASTGDMPYQAPAVFAPNLAVAPETCMGSISTGGSAAFSGAGFGLTFGTTWKSHDCELRMFARALAQLGPQYTSAAVALLAQNGDVKKALQDAGVQIPGQRVAAVAPVSTVAAAPVATAAAVQIEKRNDGTVTCGEREIKVRAANGQEFCRAN